MPRGVPADALFVNRTELTNDLIKQGCALTVSSVLRVLYFGFGILMGIAAIVARVFFDASTLVTVLVLLLGLMTVWQGSRLPMESARAMISQLMKAGDQARDRVTFATQEQFGVVLPSGKVQAFPWSSFSRALATHEMTCLTVEKPSVLFVLDNDGFLRGTPGEFAVFLADHVRSAPRTGFVAWCDRVCSTLDNWKLVQARQREKDAAKKAAKEAKKAARKKR